jgi:hypothetical protein
LSVRCFIALAGSVLFLASCSSIGYQTASLPDGLPDAHDLSTSLTRMNHTLYSFKGIGSIHLTKNGRSQHARVAWVGSVSGKLRVELLGAPGSPKTGFSSDGEWLYYYDPLDENNPVKRLSYRGSSLKRFVSIAITTHDIVSLLAGRVPDYDYQSLRVKQRKTNPGFILIRNKKWWTGSQKIHLDPSNKDLEKIEVYEGNRLVYRAEFQRLRSIKDYRVPERLVISNEYGDTFRLDIERYWANASVSPDMFILEPPAMKYK